MYAAFKPPSTLPENDEAGLKKPNLKAMIPTVSYTQHSFCSLFRDPNLLPESRITIKDLPAERRKQWQMPIGSSLSTTITWFAG